jgi:hypothetical protein
VKEKLYNYCAQLLDQKIEVTKTALRSANDAANVETKSSVGDKHETSRALMQLEQEKLSRHLSQLLNQKTELSKLDIKSPSNTVKKGSLVKTDKGYIFLSIALGKIIFEEETIFTVSALSPIGVQLLGLKEKDVADLNGTKYKIESIQ